MKKSKRIMIWEISKFIAPIVAAQILALWACHAHAEYKQVNKAEAIKALKKAPKGAEVYQCYKKAKSLDCKRVKLTIKKSYDLKVSVK